MKVLHSDKISFHLESGEEMKLLTEIRSLLLSSDNKLKLDELDEMYPLITKMRKELDHIH